jgi:hypothetical protein
MPKLDLTDEEHAAVAALVRKTIAESHYPFPDRIRTLCAALAKLEPGSAPKSRQLQVRGSGRRERRHLRKLSRHLY